MSIQTEWIYYGDKLFTGFLARPERATAPLPAVVVIQEAGGVDEHIEDVTRRMAAAGYLALAPDLFAVKGTRPAYFTRERLKELMGFFNSVPPTVWMDTAAREAELSKRTEVEAERIRESFDKLRNGGALELGSYLPHLKAALAYLRTENVHSRGQRVGMMGFCLGGGLSGLMACHDPELAGAVIFYGTPPAEALISNIKCPVLGFYGGTDKRITDAVPGFAEAMKSAGKAFEYQVYEGVGHAFFNDDRPPYNVKAVRDSFARLIDFFHRVLG